MRRMFTTVALAASILGVSAPGAVTAHPYYDDGGYQTRQVYYEGGDRYSRDDDRGYRGDGYRGRGHAYGRGHGRGRPDNYGREGYGRDGYERGGYLQRDGYAYDDRSGGRGYYEDGRCRRSNGSTGTILGAIAGGLIGNGVAGRHDRTLGTVLGAGGGAVIGNSIGRHRC